MKVYKDISNSSGEIYLRILCKLIDFRGKIETSVKLHNNAGFLWSISSDLSKLLIPVPLLCHYFAKTLMLTLEKRLLNFPRLVDQKSTD